MDPLEMLDTFEEAAVKKIVFSKQKIYSKDEVTRLLKKAYSEGRQAIHKGEYILTLEDVDSNLATVSGKEFSIQKLITEDNKYLLIVQVVDIDGDPFTDSDYSILSEELTNAAKIAGNISGVVIIPPGINLSLVTAKLDTDTYANSIGLFKKDNDDIVEKIKQMESYVDLMKSIDPIDKITKLMAKKMPLSEYDSKLQKDMLLESLGKLL